MSTSQTVIGESIGKRLTPAGSQVNTHTHLMPVDRLIVHGKPSICTPSLGRCLHRLLRHSYANRVGLPMHTFRRQRDQHLRQGHSILATLQRRHYLSQRYLVLLTFVARLFSRILLSKAIYLNHISLLRRDCAIGLVICASIHLHSCGLVARVEGRPDLDRLHPRIP